jgi:hypothetical protein
VAWMNRLNSLFWVVCLQLGTLAILVGKIWHQYGSFTASILTANIPLLLFWLAVSGILWWLTSILSLNGPFAAISFLSHLVSSFIILFLFSVLLLYLNSNGKVQITSSLLQALRPILLDQMLFSMFLYWSNTSIAYAIRYFYHSAENQKKHESYENSILIKTSFGYVLVEIESFKYVKDGDRKILFETDRSTPLNRERIKIPEGNLVEENKYRNDRSIVIDLAKIRRAVQRGVDEYVFFIGFSHELHLNAQMYKKLGGWLPRPVLDRNVALPIKKV